MEAMKDCVAQKKIVSSKYFSGYVVVLLRWSSVDLIQGLPVTLPSRTTSRSGARVCSVLHMYIPVLGRQIACGLGGEDMRIL